MRKKTYPGKLQENICFLWNDDEYSKVLKEKINDERIITSDNDLKNFLIRLKI